MSNQPSIYISHAWGGESEELVNKIVQRFKKEGLPITLDKNDLGYRESITAFMENLGRADAIILVVSQKYLHSEYCMFELLQIYENENIIERIFPVVLDEVKIAKSTDRLELVKYWEGETFALEEKIRELRSLSNIQGITEDLNLYNSIRANIAKLTGILKDINTLNIRLHRETDFDQLLLAVKTKIEKAKRSSAQILGDIEVDTQPRETSDHKSATKPIRRGLFTIILLPLLGLCYWGYTGVYKSVDQPDIQLSQSQELPKEVERDLIKIDEPDLLKEDEIKEALSLQSNPTIDPNEVSHASSATKKKVAISNHETSPVKKTTPEINKQPEKAKDIPNVKVALATKDNPEASIEANRIEEDEKKVEATVSKVSKKTISVTVPQSSIVASFDKDESSDQLHEGDIIYLLNQEEIKVGEYVVIAKGARVRAIVVEAVSSLNGGKGSLGLSFDGVETIDGKWIPISYPVYSNKGRGEVIFKKGTTLKRLKIKSTSTTISI